MTTSTEDRKRQDEKHRQTRAVKCSRDQIRVIFEDARVVVSEIVLDEEPGRKLAPDDACLALVVGYVSGVLDELGEVEVLE